MRHGFKAVAAGLFGLAGAMGAASAVTPVGTVIKNQAQATYFHPGDDRSFAVTSTIATVRVAPATVFELDNDGALRAAPDEQVAFAHILRNTGNLPDRYQLAASTVDGAGSLENPLIYLDTNENGVVDPDERTLKVTETLNPGDSIALVLLVRVPTNTVPGTILGATVTATSEEDPKKVRTRNDEVTVEAQRRFSINKSSFPLCATPIQPGSEIAYTMDLLNIDALAPFVDEIEVGGRALTGVVIDDHVPANTVFAPETGVNVSPSGAQPLVRVLGRQGYIPLGELGALDVVASVALFVPEEALLSGQSGQFTFSVRVNDDITPGTLISNVISADLDGDGRVDVQSNEACNRVAAGGLGADVSANLRFLEPAGAIRRALLQPGPESPATEGDETNPAISTQMSAPRHGVDTDYVDAPVYRLDTFPGYLVGRDGVYLEARSNTLNTDAAVQEDQFGRQFIQILVQSKETGDTVRVNLLETGTNTGLFRAEIPFRLSARDAGGGRACGPDAPESCVLKSVSGDSLRATLFDPGLQAMLADTAVVDPLGVVFDSASLAPVAGAQIALKTADGSPAIDPDTGAPHPIQITDSGGSYVIPRLAEGMYFVEVTPPGDYSFPSIVEAPVFAGRRSVDARSYGRNGFSGEAASGLFSALFEAAPPIIDIPLDPDLTLGQLSLEKSADVDTVSFGDVVSYTLRIRNGSDAVLLDVSIHDAPARGFRLLDETARLQGEPIDVVRGPGRLVTFPIGRMEVGETLEVTYRMQAGPEARAGGATNRAQADGRTGGGVPAVSLRAEETVRVSEDGLFSDRAYLIGSVWADRDGDGLRGEDEIGLPGARIWLEDGTWVETDELGRYSLYGLRPGMRIARLDPATLVEGFRASEHTGRQAGGGKSRFVDLIAGELHRADFPLACPVDTDCGQGSAFQRIAADRAARLDPSAMLDQAIAYEGLLGETLSRDVSRLREQPGPDGDISNGRLSFSGAYSAGLGFGDVAATEAARDGADVSPLAGAPSPEAAAASLGRVDITVGQWLWPLPDAETGVAYSRDGRFMAAIRPGMAPRLFVNGAEASQDTLGTLIENAVAGAQVAAWYGIELPPGDHTLEVKAEDMFGNMRVLSTLDVVRPGPAESLLIEAPAKAVAADGRAEAKLVLRAVDARGAPAMGRQFVTINARLEGSDDAVSLAPEDLQPSVPGHQVRLEDGAAVIHVAAPSRPGRVVVAADDGGVLADEVSVVFEAVMRDLLAVGVADLRASGFALSGDLAPSDAELFPEQLTTDGRTALFLKGRIRGDALLTFAYDSESGRNEGLFRDIDPEAYYPIYGDASEKGFEAQSRSKLYVRLDKGVHSAMFGDFRTDAFGGESLTALRRGLTGVNAVTGGADWTVQAFAAEARDTLRTERIRGRGLALDIRLPGAPLVRNSEVLTIETRFKDTPGLIASETTLTRFIDYLIDADTGLLTLKAPLPSFDEDGNPVFLRAAYETLGDETDTVIAGLRMESVQGARTWFAGANYDESDPDLDYRISASVGVEQALGLGRAYLEIAGMDAHTPFGSNDFDNAVRLGVDTRALGGEVRIEAAQAGLAYDNPDAPILAGRREARAEYTALISPATSLEAFASHSLEIETDNGRSVAEARLSRRWANWAFSAGPRHVAQDTSDGASHFTSAVARVSRDLRVQDRSASAFVEVEDALSDAGSRVLVGGDALVHPTTRAYVSHRIVDELAEQTFVPGLTGSQTNVSQGRTLMGVESTIIPSTDLYGEWRAAGALDGRSGEAAYGVRAQWELAEGVSLAPQLEITEVFDDGENDAAIGDAVALSMAVSDTRSERARRSVRGEARASQGSFSYAARAGWAQRFTPMVSGATKLDFARDNIDGAEDSERVRATLGFARRPARHGATDMFGLYQWLHEDTGSIDRSAHIVSTHFNRQFDSAWILSGRAAAKWSDTGGSRSSAQLAGLRLIREINRSWDAEARGSVRSTGWGDSALESLGFAAAWKPHEDVRLTLGYNFTGFTDEDLDPRGYDARGVYTQISIAIDETWFGWLRPDPR
ncbi:MAG: carboxypeptidase-like regulatory domain-containing protein [Pseudomonadota bacterium]